MPFPTHCSRKASVLLPFLWILMTPVVMLGAFQAPQALRIVPQHQASSPLSAFDSTDFDEIAATLADLTSTGATIEIPLALDAEFPPIEVAGVQVFVSMERRSLAIRGSKTLRGKPYDVMFSAHWGSRHDPRAKALSIKGPGFEGFFPAEGPLDGLSTSTAWFIISAGGHKLTKEELPTQVADYFGNVEIDVKRGLNFFSKVNVKDSHWLADAAAFLDIEQAYMDLQGFLGPQVGMVFSSDEGQKVMIGTEASLSAAIPLWTPRRLRSVFSEMTGKLEIGLGGGLEGGAKESKIGAQGGAQISLEAVLDVPFLASRERLADKIKLTGALKIERSNDKKTQYELSLGADNVAALPAFEDVFSLHDPTVKASVTCDPNCDWKQIPEFAFAAKADVGRYKNVGEIEFKRGASSGPDTTAEKKETPPFGGVPTPFKQAELLAKQKEREAAAKEKPDPGSKGKWAAQLKVAPSALRAIRPRELLLDLFNFVGNLDLLPDVPELNTLSVRFLPSIPGSMVLSGSTMLGDLPTYFIGSRVKTTDGTSGMLFGVVPHGWSFEEQFPGAEIPLLSELEISNVGLLFATAEFNASSEELYGEEYGFYRALYQRDDFTVVIKPGVNLVATLPLEGMDPNSPLVPLMDKLGAQRGPALIQGVIGTKVKDFYLRASLPPLSPPGAPAWFGHGQLDIELSGQPSIGLVGSIGIQLEEELVVFFVKTKAGREGLIVAGGMDASGGWESPFGIEWMTMNRTVLLLGLTPAGSVQLGFEGDLVVGEKDIHVAVLAALNAATGVPTNFMFDGESEAGVAVSDLVALQSRIAEARSGGNPNRIPIDRLPQLGVQDLKLKFAPKDSPELNISRGLAIGGMLTMQSTSNRPPDLIAMTDFDVGEDGVIARGAIGEFAVGPVSLSDAAIDLTLTRQDQYFRISGAGDLVVMQAAADVDFSTTEMTIDATGKAFELYEVDLHAIGKADIRNPVLSAVGTFKNDFGAAMEEELLAAAQSYAVEQVSIADRDRNNAIAAHKRAESASTNARKAWVNTPLVPRAQKVAARKRWEEAAEAVPGKLAARTKAAGRHAKWAATKTALQIVSGVEPPIRVQSGRFSGDLANMRDGKVGELEIVADVNGMEMRLTNKGFNFRAMDVGLRDMAAQIVERLFRSQN